MKLYVSSDGYIRPVGASVYSVEPARRRPKAPLSRRFYPKDLNRLKALAPRIERMTRRQLGNCLNVVRIRSIDGTLAISVKPGTSKTKHFELRDLFGWICLFDAEGK